VQVPPRTCGPTKNLYQFSKLREQYRDKYIVAAKQLNEVDSAIKGRTSRLQENPQLSEAYANLFRDPLEMSEGTLPSQDLLS